MLYKAKAYAKVNIGLRIVGKRDDGYHLLSSYFSLIPLYDEIELDISSGSNTIIKGNEEYLESGEDLMAKAVRIYKKEANLDFSASISIRKNIPTRAGLGGGSSDAGAVLKLINNHFKVLTSAELLLIAEKIGADVPFFVSGFNTAYSEGIGEKVEERKLPEEYEYIALFRARGSGVSTKDAYSRLDKLSLSSNPLPELEYPLSREKYPNDFEKIEGDDTYREMKDSLKEGDYLSLSGSGSVWFLLSREEWKGKREDLIYKGKIK